MLISHSGNLYTHYVGVLLPLNVAFFLITFWWGDTLWKLWSILVTLKLAAEANWCPTQCTPIYAALEIIKVMEVSRYLSFIMCGGWINHKQHFLHLKVINATDGEISVNSTLETLHLSILFVNTILLWITVIFCKWGVVDITWAPQYPCPPHFQTHRDRTSQALCALGRAMVLIWPMGCKQKQCTCGFQNRVP